MPLSGVTPTTPEHEVLTALAPGSPILGAGAAPGNAKGPGGFVPRGKLRNFYAGPGGRLWYYMNNYYWVSDTAPLDKLWLKAEVTERFEGLRRWPDGNAVDGPEPKVTIEYWEVSPSGRTVWVDNHRDYVLLSDHYTAGAIVVDVRLTLGHVQARGSRGWSDPEEPYLLESRNYGKGRGVGTAAVRFRPLRGESVNTWQYRVPWDTHPQRLTRSNWKRLPLPSWRFVDRKPPPAAEQEPVVTPSASVPGGS